MPRTQSSLSLLAVLLTLNFTPDIICAGVFVGGPPSGHFDAGSPSGIHNWPGFSTSPPPLPVAPTYQLQGTDIFNAGIFGFPADPLHPGAFTYQAGLYGGVTPQAVYIGIANGTFIQYTSPL